MLKQILPAPGRIIHVGIIQARPKQQSYNTIVQYKEATKELITCET